jgi:catechol 2,3-dioxygenase-like lactoylglutathione lyase family enzyme
MTVFSEVNSLIVRIDHIQIAAPKGCESDAREFYGSILGLAEIEKPASLAGRGGCWFQCGDQQLHIGVESAFQPARKAHPAFAVAGLDKLRESLITHAVKITDDDALPGTRRFFAADPWGNRLEFVEVKS